MAFTQSDDLPALKLLPLRFTLRARTPLQLPRYKGSTVRGGFGTAFKQTVCVVEHRDCGRCLLRTTCAYPYVFDTPVPGDATRLRKYTAAPHPFVLLPPLEKKERYEPGECLHVGWTLIGKGAQYLRQKYCPDKDLLMAHTAVTDETLDYPDSDGLPMAENEAQFWPILYVDAALDRYFQARDDVYVVGNLLLYYQEGNPRQGDFGKSVSPDLMVVLGAPKHVRSSYRLWEEPKAPDFVLGIASESTYRVDQVRKRAIYADIGVSEYWQVDPVGSYLRPPLQGFRLVGGHYAPIPHTEEVDGSLTGRSSVVVPPVGRAESAGLRAGDCLGEYVPGRSGQEARHLCGHRRFGILAGGPCGVVLAPTLAGVSAGRGALCADSPHGRGGREPDGAQRRIGSGVAPEPVCAVAGGVSFLRSGTRGAFAQPAGSRART